ncbi:hypothetical protein [Streptomyces tubercidicus]|uniref:hypothetical protein n=1 Tax=Streptomyces tubercidicus TaxID=47759 RepID=UPI0036D09814
MKRSTSRIGAVSAAGLLAFTGMIFAGAPAQAAGGCSRSQHKELSTSGYDVDIYVKMCIYYNGATYVGTAQGYWQEAGGHKFDNFDVQARVEEFGWTKSRKTSDQTAEINGRTADSFQVQAEWLSGQENGFTADGKITYNINDDGKGDMVWNLAGSPAV